MKVLITGAGIGGLTLAASLKKFAPDVTYEIFEQDEGAFSRPQGYAIGMKGDGGLAVLAELGLKDTLLKKDSVRVSDFIFTDENGKELLSLKAADEAHMTYRVQRQHLKQTLLDALDPSAIHYGHAASGYSQDEQGVELTLTNGRKVRGDYLVACDGVASPLRQQMAGDSKHYLGLAAIFGDAHFETNNVLLDGGYFMTLGRHGDSVFAYRQPGGNIHFSFTSHTDSDQALMRLPQDELFQKVHEATAAWHPLVQEIVAHANKDSLAVRGYYDKEPLSTIRDNRVWLLGDAAHPMCPFQGQGGNLAMKDALDFATWLGNGAKGAADLEDMIVRRGRKAVLESRNSAVQFHQTNTFMQFNRNIGFKMANFFIKMFSKKK